MAQKSPGMDTTVHDIGDPLDPPVDTAITDHPALHPV